MEHRVRRPVLPIVTGALLALVTMVALFALLAPPQTAHSATQEALAAKSLTRDLEPVVLTGSDLPGLMNAPVGDIFVVAFSGTTPVQIPAQVDERDGDDDFVANEDGLFDANDELVFMAGDSGDEAPPGTKLSELLSVNATWFEVEVVDPVTPANKGWAYVVRSATLSEPATDYVDFDPTNHRVEGESYTLGFATPDPWADFLTLGPSGPDILDRNKVQACHNTFGCFTEEDIPGQLGDDVIKDGKVRVIIRNGRVLGYGSMLSWSTGITVPPLVRNVTGRLMIDFSPAAAGSTLYNAVAPGGVTVDGNPDSVPGTPISSWFQLSTDEGTLISVSDLDPAKVGTVLANHYEDENAIDPDDTGDQRRFGEVGFVLTNLPALLIYQFNLYALEGNQENVGADYAEYFETPLATTVTSFTDVSEGDQFIYLPAVVVD